MRRTIGPLAVAAALFLLGFAMPAGAQNSPRNGRVIVPNSSVEHPGDAGVRAHTNFSIFAPENAQPAASSPSGETPASLGCVYQVVSTLVTGCPISGTTVDPSGGSGAIAIVDAYDDPNAASDLATFSTQFGLPAANFTKVYASGKKPPTNSGWALEESLDIEWAHAMAPNAAIYLVEAASSSNSALYTAESVASSTVAAARGGEVSNSWGGSETSGETSDDKYFTTSGVVFFASAGDSPGVIYPSASPDVVSAGGTTINRSGGNFTSETTWSDGGGGKSRYEKTPSYQSGVTSVVGTARGTPDFSFDANPNSGVSVYDSTPYDGASGWWVVGGTSVSSPSLSGIVSSAGHFYTSTNLELTNVYGNLGVATDFRDITSGSCGTNKAKTGYDLCTGVGSDIGLVGK